MPDQEQTELVRAAHVVGGVSQSINDKGIAVAVFNIADPAKPLTDKPTRFAITMTPEMLPVVRQMLTDLIAAANRMTIGRHLMFYNRPKNIEVGHDDNLRGACIISFDPRTQEEAAYLLRNDDALNIATGIQEDVLPRMTEPERRKWKQSQHKIVPVPRPTLIIPGR